MWHLIRALREMRAWSARKRELASRARSLVAGGGGEVRRIGAIGLLLRAPFKGIGGRPVYLRIDCDYPDDRGFWLVRALEGGEEQWVWTSGYGKSDLPPGAPSGATVDNRVIVLPFIITILLWLCLLGGIAAVFLWPLLT
ncbi:MAG: hypothetical protein ACYTFI_16870 [Planctomycetota bacterium]